MNKNPLIEKCPLRVIKSCVSFGNGLVIIGANNEYVPSGEGSGKIYYYEQENKTSFSRSIESVYFQLTRGTKDVLFYILCNVPKNKDIIILSESKLKAHLACGRTKITAAIKELTELEFISKVPQTQNRYYINASLFFNGNRVHFFEKNYPDQIEVAYTRKQFEK